VPALTLLLIPVVLYLSWELVVPYLPGQLPNPFYTLLFISCRIPGSSDADPRYGKGFVDVAFVAYYIVFWSFVRQSITIHICTPIARYFRLRTPDKIARFGEQGYALVYFSFFGIWGYVRCPCVRLISVFIHLQRMMTQLPTYWYRTEYMWIGASEEMPEFCFQAHCPPDYPHWELKPELKRYYLMQIAYWCQQLLVLLLKLEKPRKDYNELMAHHFVTLWLVGYAPPFEDEDTSAYFEQLELLHESDVHRQRYLS
jgi:acyl-CoA-dependent ceramide synthase